MTWSIENTNLYNCEIKVSSLPKFRQAYHLKEMGRRKWSKKLEHIVYYDQGIKLTPWGMYFAS